MPSLTGDARNNRKKCAWRGLRRPRCCGAVDTPGIVVVDLGLSGSDFSELKARYGFVVSVGNCPAAADYASLLCCRSDAAKYEKKFWYMASSAVNKRRQIPEIMVIFYQIFW